MTETIETAGQHDLIFYVNRNTPKVVPKGASPGKVPQGYGAQTKRRPATEDEEKVIAKGGWLRVNKGGKKPGQPGYKGGSNYRPQLRKKDAAELTDADFETVEISAALTGGTTAADTIFANVGPWAPEYHKIIKIEWTANGPQSTVVQDYKLVGDLNAVMEDAAAELGLLDAADSDDTPEASQLLMSAWQALAMYLSSCDDEDKAGAVQALKMVSSLMVNGSDDGPTPSTTFGMTTQVAANTTTWECPMDKRSFSTEGGLISHLQSMHNFSQPKAAKFAGKQS